MTIWGRRSSLSLSLFLLSIGLSIGTACGDAGEHASPAGSDAGTDVGGHGGKDGSAGHETGGGSGSAGSAGSSGASDACAHRNEYSWNGSWLPADTDFPIDGLLDNEYFDGHPDAQGNPTPILPPGEWDWDDSNDDLANWRNFEQNIGAFELLRDDMDRPYGWQLAAVDASPIDFSGAAAYFHGSPGTDRLLLQPGSIHSFGDGTLGDGPDVLTFCESYSLHFRTGGSSTGSLRDDDLVIAGCEPNPDGTFDVTTTTIHTGPGADWVFIRDLDRAAVDLGNGADGRTDAIDPNDGDDLVVLRGNTHDFRVFGGHGDDVFVWYVDDNVQTSAWLGPNFFGGGGIGDALWSDEGTDRLVLVIPPADVVNSTPTPPGSVLVRTTDGVFVDDAPTANDPFAHYCVECGTSPAGRKTVILEYVSADESVATGYFYLTGIERLQIGIGEQAKVYTIDDTNGTVIPEAGAAVLDPPAWPSGSCP